MVLAHHLILTGYGHWLPNDPRGSMSRDVSSQPLRPLGDRHYGRKVEQPSLTALKDFHKRAREVLMYPILWFDAPHREALAREIALVVRESRLTCYACAVLNNHVHILIRKHKLNGNQMLDLLKERLSKAIRAAGLVPADHPVFSADSCDVFKDTRQAIHGCIAYIHGNFAKHKLPAVVYDFVQHYDGWPHKGP